MNEKQYISKKDLIQIQITVKPQENEPPSPQFVHSDTNPRVQSMDINRSNSNVRINPSQVFSSLANSLSTNDQNQSHLTTSKGAVMSPKKIQEQKVAQFGISQEENKVDEDKFTLTSRKKANSLVNLSGDYQFDSSEAKRMLFEQDIEEQQVSNTDFIRKEILDKAELKDSQTLNEKKNKKKGLFQDEIGIKRSCCCCGKCFFTWVSPVINYVKKTKILKVEDLGLLQDQDKAKLHINNLKDVWQEKIKTGVTSKNDLMKSVLIAFKSEYIKIMCLNALQAVLNLLSPFIIKPLITYIKTGKNALYPHIKFWTFTGWFKFLTPEIQYGIFLALLLVFTQGFVYLIAENANYMQNMVGAKSTNALVGIVYEKQLRISPATNKIFSNGEIITFVQVDAQKMQYLSAQLPAVATLPFTLSICFGLLFYFLHLSFFAGVGVFILSLVCNIWLSRILAKLQKIYMRKQDSRVSMTTEMLNNIKMIKLYSWIEIFKTMIDEKRQIELSALYTRMKITIITLASLTFFPLFLQWACFSVFIGSGNQIDLPIAYTVVTIFNLMNSPIKMLPMFIGQFIEFTVSMRRIQKFLECQEVNPTIITTDQSNVVSDNWNQETALEINGNANFHWGVNMAINNSPPSSPNGQTQETEDDDEKRSSLLKKHNEVIDSKQEEIIESEFNRENQNVSNFLALKNINLKVKKGDFVCIIGDVGSGKSTLLSTLIGDSLYLPNEVMQQIEKQNINNPYVKQQIFDSSNELIHPNQKANPIGIYQKLSFVQQIPWIQNKTIRDNIIFGLPYIKGKYQQTIKMCELTRDLEILPAGDQTEIGEKGINLSGGQKARVSLARAVYADRDIIIMDDPISALDADVKKKIFYNVFAGILKNKTRILVTHAVDFLHLVDNIVLLKNGEIILQGSYSELQQNPYLLQLMEIFKSHQQEQSGLIERNNPLELDIRTTEMKNNNDMRDSFDQDGHKTYHEQERSGSSDITMKNETDATVVGIQPVDGTLYEGNIDQLNALIMKERSWKSTKKGNSKKNSLTNNQVKKSDGSLRNPNKKCTVTSNQSKFDQKRHSISRTKSDNSVQQSQIRKLRGKMMTNENDEEILLNFSLYKKLFVRYYGWGFILSSQSVMIFFTASKIANDYTLGGWAYSEKQYTDFWFFCGLSLVFMMACSVGVYGRAASCQLFTLKATKQLHSQMINRIVRAPVNLYYDITPIGRILNKFSKDINSIEIQNGWILGMFLSMIYQLIQVFIVAIYAVPWVALIVPFVALMGILLVKKSAKAIKETVRLQNTTKSPILSYLGETINGSSTIRAFNRQEEFIEGVHVLLDKNIVATQIMVGVSNWFAIRVDILAIIIMFIMCVVCIVARELPGADTIVLSMILSYLMTIQFSLTWSLKQFMNLQNNMVNASRCFKMLEVPQERVQGPNQKDLLKDRDNWPENGKIEFKNVFLRYRPTTEIVLKSLSFEVKPGDKIGVVGRTGAGKSTICLSMSRIVEIFQGQILIDDIDIQSIQIEQLRKRITVIPQDPTMFTGTLKFNLDPENVVSDIEIVSLLKQAQLEALLDGDPDGLYQNITENGQNLSSGERQLICICRAIIRKSKVVILDEATANIDMVTEQKIQTLITSQFTNSTMIVIAHRLNTIIQSDKVLVLSFGQIKEYDSPQNLMKDPTTEFSQLLKEIEKKQLES